MEKLDRLGWAGGICFRSYGLRIGVRVSKLEALERLVDCLPPGWEPSDSAEVDGLFSYVVGGSEPMSNVRRYHILYSGLQKVARTMNEDTIADVLEAELQLFVAEWAGERVFVHAGVVGWKGRALVLPGRSQSGKSTLVAALLRLGASYYSDEYAVLDRDGKVHPYARKLSLRQPAGRPRRVDAGDLGAISPKEPLAVGTVAFASYQPSRCWRPDRLTPGKALLEMYRNTVPARSRPQLSLSALERIVPCSVNLKGARGEAAETAAALLETL
jgi:hypothetical protein